MLNQLFKLLDGNVSHVTTHFLKSEKIAKSAKDRPLFDGHDIISNKIKIQKVLLQEGYSNIAIPSTKVITVESYQGGKN